MTASPADGSSDAFLLAGRYAVGEPIGRGRSTVHRGEDTRLQRPVAMKEVRLAETQEGVERARVRALREARAAARLDNPSVVTVYDVVEEGGSIWLVMELVKSPSLAQIVADGGPLDHGRAARIGLGVLGALESAHAVGIVHRDVKPANVLVARDDRIKLADFGVAAIHDESQVTATGTIVGSPSYMAPEQAMAAEVGPYTDLWALGATLYFAVEGCPPFAGDSPLATASAVVHGEPRRPQNRGPLTPVLQRLLQKDPARRPDAGQVRAMLRSAAVRAGASPDITLIGRPAWGETRPRDTRQMVVPAAPAPAAAPAESPEPPKPPSGAGAAGAVGAEPDLPSTVAVPPPGAADTADVPGPPAAFDASAPGAEAAPVGTSAGAGDDPARPAADPAPVAAANAIGAAAAALAAGEDPAGPGAGAGTGATTAPDPASDGAGEPAAAMATAAAGAPPAATPPAAGEPGGAGAAPADGPSAASRTDRPRPLTVPVLVAAVVVLALVAAAAWAMGDADGGGDESSPTTAPSETSAGAGDEGATTTTTEATTTTESETVPEGWTVYRDPAGAYRIAHPAGWQIQPADGNRTRIRDPETGSYLMIDWIDPARPDPVADWRAQAGGFAARHEAYQEIRIEPYRYRDYDAAIWEFRYRDEGVDLHVANLGFIVDGRGYALYFQTHEDQWAASQDIFAAFRQAFRPS
ncbi:MAG TPA: serine/threonine-protein kinase [Acidimicrobiales bacterium]